MRRALAFVLPILALTAPACGAPSAATDTTPKPAPSTAPPPPPAPVASSPVKPAYPPSTKRPVVDLYRDVRVSDDYRWLEDWSDPNVQAWSESQNKFARKWLDGTPGREAIRARIEQLMGESSARGPGSSRESGAYFALESKPPKQHPTWWSVRRSTT